MGKIFEAIRKIFEAIIGLILLLGLLWFAWSLFAHALPGVAQFIQSSLQTNPWLGIPLLVIGIVLGLVMLIVGLSSLG